MEILQYNVRIKRYVEVVQVQVIPAKSIQTPNRSAQTARVNIVQTTVTTQFSLIKMESFCHLFLTRYGARFRFP